MDWALVAHSRDCKPFKSLSVQPEELKRLLDELDAAMQLQAITQRKHERHAYRAVAALILVDQSGAKSSFIVPLRNLSRGGCAFLHRSMIHTGSPCRASLRSADEKWLHVEGKIVRARYVRGMVYEIGVKFDHEIDLARFGLKDKPKPQAPSRDSGW